MKASANFKMVLRVLAITIALICVLIFIRARTLGFNFLFFFQGFSAIKQTILLGYEDYLLSLGLGFFFAIVLWFTKPYLKLARFLFALFIVLVTVILFLGVINISAIDMLELPLTYQLLYYADLFESDYLLNLVGKETLIMVVLIFILISCITFLLGWGITLFLKKMHPGLMTKGMGLLSILIIAFLFLSRGYVQATKQHTTRYAKTVNPVIHFAKSYYLSKNEEADFIPYKAKTEADLDEFRYKQKPGITSAPTHEKIKNVVIYVMESTSAQYIAGYGKLGEKVTPNIAKHLSEAICFKNIYAANPNSSNSLFSIMGALYPMISFYNTLYEYPALEWPTISSILHKQQYNTAFFSSTDNTYSKVDEYLSNRKLNTVLDFRSIPCDAGTIKSDAEGVGYGVSERCTVDAFSKWASQSSKPFFSILWTVQSHWPYFTFGKEEAYVKDQPALNKYLNALHETDSALGKLLDDLKQNGLAESTLVIVVGDHGEAFGQHGQIGHGSNVYEENVHVPLIMINPLLFKNASSEVVGSHLDIAPTILDILQTPSPAQWEGISLFDSTHKNESRFYSTWSDYMIGYRKENFKYIYNVFQGKMMIFDLKNDPEEKNDLSGKLPNQVDSASKHLSLWMQYQKKATDARLKNENIIQAKN